MSVFEYEGPVIGVFPRSGEVIWQYGFRQADGTVLLLSRGNGKSPHLLRRPLVPAGDWEKVETPGLASDPAPR